MSLVSFTPIVDGSTGTATQVNTPLSTIYNDYNGNITNANIAASAAIALTKLGITVTSYSNGGSAGGTFYYINFGGIKMLWGITNVFSITGSGALQSTAQAVTLPTSFFATIQNITTSIGSVPTGTSALFGTLQAQTGLSSISVVLNQSSGTNGAAAISVFIIGS